MSASICVLPPVEVKFATDGAGQIGGYASTYGGPADVKGDVIAPGAFANSLAEHVAAGTVPLMLWQHDPAKPIGVWNSLAEDDRGLRVAGQLTLDCRDGADAYALAKARALNGLSIGFRVRDFERRPGGGRVLKDIDLIEISVVTFPAATRARIDDVKSALADVEAHSGTANAEMEIKVEDIQSKDSREEVIAEAKQHGALDAALSKLNDRLDRMEVRLNRPGTAIVVENKADSASAVFTKFLRSGREALDAIEVKDMRVSDDTAGGFLVPEQFVAELIKNIVQFSPIRSIARVSSISGNVAVLPRRTGTLTANWVGEVSTRSETQPSYGQVRYAPNESACFVDVSNVMLEDAAIDIAAELAMDFAEEFGRLEGAAFVSGDGVNKPSGFMLDANVGYTPSGLATAIAADALIDIYHAIPAPYRAAGTWIMNAATLGAVRKLKDGGGQYLVALGGMANSPVTTILGRPIVEAPDMPDIGAGTYPIAFGDFNHAYRIFDRVQLAVLRDPYSVATSGLTRFHARRRVAGGVAKAEAIRRLKIAVS